MSPVQSLVTHVANIVSTGNVIDSKWVSRNQSGGSPSKMITVGMNYQVIEGKQTAFEEKFAAVINALCGAEGHQSSTLWRDVSNDTSYLITSDWSEEQAFRDFIQSQAFKDVTTWGNEQILAGRPQHKVYRK